MSNVTSLEITNLFNCLSSHFIDNFARFNAAALTNMAKYLTPTNYITFNDNKPFTIVNLSALILKIFTTNNPLHCGENALRFIDFVKSTTDFNDGKTWISQELKLLCQVQIMTLGLDNTLNEQQNQPITINDTLNQTITNPSQSEISQILKQFRSNLQSDFDDKLKSYIQNSMSKSAKDEHYQELQSYIKRVTILDNSLTIHKMYKDNKVYQKSINSCLFPKPWKTEDPIYVNEFNKLILCFQQQIQDFNIRHIEEQLTEINISIDAKLEMIKSFDINALDKFKALRSQTINLLKHDQDKSVEKCNRLITMANDTYTNKSVNVRTSSYNPPQSNYNNISSTNNLSTSNNNHSNNNSYAYNNNPNFNNSNNSLNNSTFQNAQSNTTFQNRPMNQRQNNRYKQHSNPNNVPR